MLTAVVIRRPTKLALVVVLAMVILGARHVGAAVIPVLSLQQKTNGVGPCSLQEAIYSANFDSSVAINGYTGSNPRIVSTQCEPGSGDDTIVLPTGAVLYLSKIVDDPDNQAGPTANPIIASRITVLANGATLQKTGNVNFRLFTVSDTGYLSIQRAFIRGFQTQGGNGRGGGGGGMGAGGAIYVIGGTLVAEACTFEGNAAFGGAGASHDIDGHGGGGGGLGGHAGPTCYGGGGGGGGARGNGGPCDNSTGGGGGGGGTISNGILSTDPNSIISSKGGFRCGGNGRRAHDGESAVCPGGGGGGAGESLFRFPGESGWDGGKGHYGGGGGGGTAEGDGGGGGFGGGGGSSGLAGAAGENGGNGGYGGGGGSGDNGFVTDGNSGDGGFLAGNATTSGGGGGAGLGGAIFNDSGTIEIRNSTFHHNNAIAGISAKGHQGKAGGAAIFSRNGNLTVLNATITDNYSIGGIGGGIMVHQSIDTIPTMFTLENTILANNGDNECAITGFTIVGDFAGNLITRNADLNGTPFDARIFIGCPGVVTVSDPQLGPLQYNLGATPTMAISSSSPAHDAADPGTSLPLDQRRSRRPSGGGFDIGAFELCDNPLPSIGIACGLLTRPIFDFPELTPETVLDVQVQPPGRGTTIPAPGPVAVDVNTVVPLSAIANQGFRFVTWSNNVANPAQPSTTIFVQASQPVIAYFEPCACAADASSSISVTRGPYVLNPVTRRYAQTVTVTNTSTAILAAPLSLVLDNLANSATLYNATGVTQNMLPAGSPYINANTTLGPGQGLSITLQFTAANTTAISYDTRVLAGPGSK